MDKKSHRISSLKRIEFNIGYSGGVSSCYEEDFNNFDKNINNYKSAQMHENERQEFLDNFNMEEYVPFVEKLIYVPEDSRIMFTTYCLLQKDNTKSNIFICEESFKKFNYESFKNVLISHEGFHAMQNYRPLNLHNRIAIAAFNLGIKNKKALEIVYSSEVEAYFNQINHSSFKECPTNFQLVIMSRLKGYKEELEKINPSIKLEEILSPNHN